MPELMRDRIYAILFVLVFVALMYGVFMIMLAPATPAINYQATPMSRPGGP